jgi:signal recognition particle subunit SRP54
LKLGPLNKVMGMIPGIPPWMSQSIGGGDGGDRIKGLSFVLSLPLSSLLMKLLVFMYMMDSMTDDELDGKVDFSPSRVNRIARGSGQSPEHVQVLLKCHKQFEGVIKKMGKSGLMKGGDEMMNKKMQRNPQAVMQQLSKAMDPRMLAQMGGAGNVMNMMKEMSKMDMNDMGSMQKMMGAMGLG